MNELNWCRKESKKTSVILKKVIFLFSIKFIFYSTSPLGGNQVDGLSPVHTLWVNGAKHSPWIFLIFLSWGRGQDVDSEVLTCLCIKVSLGSIFTNKYWHSVKILKQPSNEFIRKSFLSSQNCSDLKKNDDTLSIFHQKMWPKMMKNEKFWKSLKVTLYHLNE